MPIEASPETTLYGTFFFGETSSRLLPSIFCNTALFQGSKLMNGSYIMILLPYRKCETDPAIMLYRKRLRAKVREKFHHKSVIRHYLR
jgi:hypothetical protein